MKTYKRELAVALFVWLGYIVETKDGALVETLAWLVFAFGAAAFGLDAAAKQLWKSPVAGRHQRGGEYASGEREYAAGRGEAGESDRWP